MSGFDDTVRRVIAEQLDEITALMRENGKLRELVKSMYYDLSHQTFPPDWVADYTEDMRELGIEAE